MHFRWTSVTRMIKALQGVLLELLQMSLSVFFCSIKNKKVSRFHFFVYKFCLRGLYLGLLRTTRLTHEPKPWSRPKDKGPAAGSVCSRSEVLSCFKGKT